MVTRCVGQVWRSPPRWADGSRLLYDQTFFHGETYLHGQRVFGAISLSILPAIIALQVWSECIYNISLEICLIGQLQRKFFGKIRACGKEKEIMLIDSRTHDSDLSISFARWQFCPQSRAIICTHPVRTEPRSLPYGFEQRVVLRFLLASTESNRLVSGNSVTLWQSLIPSWSWKKKSMKMEMSF